VELCAPIKAGDTIRIKGTTSDFTQVVKSMQVKHTVVKEATSGDSIGLKVKDHAREGDKVFLE